MAICFHLLYYWYSSKELSFVILLFCTQKTRCVVFTITSCFLYYSFSFVGILNTTSVPFPATLLISTLPWLRSIISFAIERPKSCSSHFSSTCFVYSVEAFKNTWQVLFWDSNSIIYNFNVGIIVYKSHINFDGSFFLGVFNTVRKYI